MKFWIHVVQHAGRMDAEYGPLCLRAGGTICAQPRATAPLEAAPATTEPGRDTAIPALRCSVLPAMPTGCANARPMTGSATKQSRAKNNQGFASLALAMMEEATPT